VVGVTGSVTKGKAAAVGETITGIAVPPAGGIWAFSPGGLLGLQAPDISAKASQRTIMIFVFLFMGFTSISRDNRVGQLYKKERSINYSCFMYFFAWYYTKSLAAGIGKDLDDLYPISLCLLFDLFDEPESS
jgi:hypothetical protein